MKTRPPQPESMKDIVRKVNQHFMQLGPKYWTAFLIWTLPWVAIVLALILQIDFRQPFATNFPWFVLAGSFVAGTGQIVIYLLYAPNRNAARDGQSDADERR
jgi:hypothetical protein